MTKKNSISGADYSQQLYHSHLTLFKIITATIQTESWKGPNKRCGKGISNSHHKTRKTSTIYKPTANKNARCKTQQTVTHTIYENRCHVCSIKSKDKRMNFKYSECKNWLCPSQRYQLYQTKLHFYGPAYLELAKQSTQI